MIIEDFYVKACEELKVPNWRIRNNKILLKFSDGSVTEEQIKTKATELFEIWKTKQYQRDRKQEYPSIQELVVALYDADDKAEIDKKRAEIKKKYPKPE